MNFRATLPGLCAPLLLTILVALDSSSSVQAQAPASADAILAQIRERSHVPGLAASVVRDGRIIAAGISGTREMGKPDAIQLTDSFVIGSCT